MFNVTSALTANFLTGEGQRLVSDSHILTSVLESAHNSYFKNKS